MSYSRFGRGGVFTCRMCGKRTRQTDSVNANVELCGKCLDRAEMENAHSDNCHDEAPDPGCPLCKEKGLLS